MERERANIGFEDDLETFDPADWAVGYTPRDRVETGAARKVAEATGFRSREDRSADGLKGQPAERAERAAGGAEAPQPRRRRTGRNAQFNLKARPDTIQSFCAVADAQGWGLGETLEQAVVLLQRAYGTGQRE